MAELLKTIYLVFHMPPTAGTQEGGLSIHPLVHMAESYSVL